MSNVLFASLLLTLMAVLAGGAALRESVTIDEISHIGSGVSYLQKLDLRMNPEHPPLPKILAALPLIVHGVRADYTHKSWSFSEKFFPAFVGQWVFGEWLLEKWNEPKTTLSWARLPMLLLMLALGYAVKALRRIGFDEYGFSDPTVYVPQAQNWNCQSPTSEQGGEWVALSGNLILDGHNCVWLMQYPHEALAGGSMYAVHLPAQIPAAGDAGGPPLPSARREFAGMPFDIRSFFVHVYQNPEDLPPAVEWLQATFIAIGKSPGPVPKPPWDNGVR